MGRLLVSQAHLIVFVKIAQTADKAIWAIAYFNEIRHSRWFFYNKSKVGYVLYLALLIHIPPQLLPPTGIVFYFHIYPSL